MEMADSYQARILRRGDAEELRRLPHGQLLGGYSLHLAPVQLEGRPSEPPNNWAIEIGRRATRLQGESSSDVCLLAARTALAKPRPVTLKDRAAIVGIGQLPFSKNIGRSEDVTALEAAKLALADAGLRATDIDGMTKWSIQVTSENVIARNLGVPNLRFFGEVGYGGGGGCGVVGHAAAAIAAGMARCVLVYRSRNRGSGGRPWAGTSRERDQSAAEGNETAFYSPYGFVRPVDQVAMFARRFLHERGYTTRHLGWIAVAMRRHASNNPMAMMREPITVEDHQRARFISEPLRLLDCCLETDGAAAVVVAAADLARDLRQKPAWIMGASQGMGPRNFTMNNFFKDPFLESPGAYAARDLWRMAGVEPKDVQVAQLYDAFTPLVLGSLEEYCFCKPG